MDCKNTHFPFLKEECENNFGEEIGIKICIQKWVGILNGYCLIIEKFVTIQLQPEN